METQERDINKMIGANKRGISIIRIFQEDVWNDENNWKKELNKHLKVYDLDSPKNILIGDIYEDSIYEDAYI